jgi:hypothetical protein
MATKRRGTIPNLIQGVSHQPAVMRLDGQGAEMLNYDASVVDGLSRRSGSYFVNTLSLPAGSAVYSYTRSGAILSEADEAYTFTVAPDGTLTAIKDYGIGTQPVVTQTAAAKAYLVSGAPESALSFHTIADATFVANNTKTCAMTADVTPAYPRSTLCPANNWEVLVRCVGANFGVTYKVLIDGVEKATYTTAVGVATDKITFIPVEEVVTDLVADLVVNTIAATQYRNYIYIVGTGTQPSITVDDGRGSADFRIYTHSVDDLGKLPPDAPHEFTLKVTGTDKTEFNDYYMRAKHSTPTANFVNTEMSWEEVTGPNIETTFDKTTMPVQVQQDGSGNFSMDVITWLDRRVGDDDTNPKPSFIGNRINSVGTFQSRLFFLSDENAIFSQTNDHFDFWADTARDVKADDVIDMSTSAPEVTILKDFIMINKDLMLLSDRAQFIIDGSTPFTATGAFMALTSQYSLDLTAKSVLLGTRLYMGMTHGPLYAGVREYRIDDLTANASSNVLTEQVPDYLGGNVKQLAGNTNRDILFARTDADPETLFVFQQYWKDDERLQAAWSKWTFKFDVPTEIINITMDKDILYVWSREVGNERVVIQKVNLQRYDLFETELTFQVCLDNMVQFQHVAPDVDGWSIVALTGIEMGNVDEWALIPTIGGYRLGTDVNFEIESTGVNTTTIKYKDANFPVEALFLIGRKYTSNYELTLPHLRDSAGVAIDSNKMHIDHLTFSHKAVSTYSVKTTYDVDLANPFLHVFTTNQLDSWTPLLGTPINTEGFFNVPIREQQGFVKVELIVEDSHLPVSFSSVAWQGQFNN